MAKLYISEFAGVTWGGNSTTTNQLIAAPNMPPMAEQSIDIGMASNKSAAFSAQTRFIQINCDAACCIAVGSSSITASASYHRMAADETRWYGVNPGLYIAVIQAS